MASGPPTMHLASSRSIGSQQDSSDGGAASSESGTRVMTEEPGRYGQSNAPLTSSPGEVEPSYPASAMRRKIGERQGTGHVSLAEPPYTSRQRASTDEAGNEHGHHHGFSEKMHGLRHRTNKRGDSGNGSQTGRPTPQRSLSTGPRGFLQRIATVGEGRQAIFM